MLFSEICIRNFYDQQRNNVNNIKIEFQNRKAQLFVGFKKDTKETVYAIHHSNMLT